MAKDKILVFLSRPNPFLEEQQKFIDKLKMKLKEYSLETITLQADEYDLTDTINYLKGMIKKCYGIIVVGFKQIFIDKGSKKRGGIDNPNFFNPSEIDLSGQALSSPFCHIEGTIGLLNDLPLLIINEEGVREDGILKGGRFSVKTKKFNLNKLESFFDSEIFNEQLMVWTGKVTDYYLFLNLKKV